MDHVSQLNLTKHLLRIILSLDFTLLTLDIS